MRRVKKRAIVNATGKISDESSRDEFQPGFSSFGAVLKLDVSQTDSRIENAFDLGLNGEPSVAAEGSLGLRPSPAHLGILGLA